MADTTRALGDVMKDLLEKSWYSSRIQQKLFGGIPEIERFIGLTLGEIAIQPQLAIVAPLSASIYPFEIYIEYKANPNGILVPVFSKQLKHYESIERITEEEYDALDKEELNIRFVKLGQHKKIKMQMIYGRDAVVNLHEY
jgi:hypothetical protein